MSNSSVQTPQNKTYDAVLTAPPTIQLRMARPADAEYIHSLRIDPAYNQHLSQVSGDASGQARFLENYVKREEAGQEYYFIIKNKATGKDCGTVRIYDLREDSFCWGSWILDAGKPRLAAVESALFIYDFGFGVLGFESSHFDVRKDNTRVISFHERFGAQRIDENDMDVFFKLNRKTFEEKLPDLTTTTSYKPIYLGG